MVPIDSHLGFTAQKTRPSSDCSAFLSALFAKLPRSGPGPFALPHAPKQTPPSKINPHCLRKSYNSVANNHKQKDNPTAPADNPTDLFNDVLERHLGMLFRIARIYCANEDQREDVFQEMLIKIWQSLPAYDHQYSFPKWLNRVAVSVAISYYRKHIRPYQNALPLPEEFEGNPDDTNHEKEEQLHRLDRFISELSPQEKGLMLHLLDKKSHSEIAELTGLSVTNVGTKLSRIREKLRQRFLQAEG